MTERRAYGTLENIDGRPALRFERSLAYPIERVWRAVSTPSELERFFPGAADWTPAAGESIDVGGLMIEVTEVDAPRRLAWTFAGQPQSFDLVADGGDCRLTFTHVIDDLPAAQTATGWEIYLSRLEPHLAGGFLSDEEAHKPWAEIHELYAERFGVDPATGTAMGGAESAHRRGPKAPMRITITSLFVDDHVRWNMLSLRRSPGRYAYYDGT